MGFSSKCHSESRETRDEESLQFRKVEILRCAQNDSSQTFIDSLNNQVKAISLCLQ